jgi:hypothetical protein
VLITCPTFLILNVVRQLKKLKMKGKIFLIIITLGIATIASSQTIIDKKANDTIQLTESLKQDDLAVNEYLTNELKPIRENFKRLNSIENWTEIKVVGLLESTEGGGAIYYSPSKKLEKIITRHFGETFQKLAEYYLKDGKLSFVFEKLYKYNRPFYYDSSAKEENNDTEEFDFDKSEIIEDRSYFSNGKLLHQLNNQDCGSPFASDYLLEEQKRLLTEFKKLIELEKTK